MPKKRKSRAKREDLKNPCGCHYCTGTTYDEWLEKKYKHLKFSNEKISFNTIFNLGLRFNSLDCKHREIIKL
jgi:hypothetical protein